MDFVACFSQLHSLFCIAEALWKRAPKAISPALASQVSVSEAIVRGQVTSTQPSSGSG